MMWSSRAGFLLAGVFALSACQSGGAAGGAAGAEAAKAAPKADLVFADPSGDDNGPGSYKYPTGSAYAPGDFDIRELKVVPKGDTVEFRLKLRSVIKDPWKSKEWGGNGFSVQMAAIHLDTDHKAGSGEQASLPGFNVRFKPEEAWDKVVVISPQGVTRLNSEVDAKAAAMKARVVVPKRTFATGKTLVAVVDAAQLGGLPQLNWGYQVLMQSNEGYPAKGDLLTRKVNEYEGEHRFGGGTDFDNDPQVIDILVAPAEGGAGETKAQHELLSKYNKAATEPTPADLAVVPMVYPAP